MALTRFAGSLLQLVVTVAVLVALGIAAFFVSVFVVSRGAWLAGYDPMLTPGKVRELRHPDWRCDNGPFSAAVGWSPRVTLSAALRRNTLVPA